MNAREKLHIDKWRKRHLKERQGDPISGYGEKKTFKLDRLGVIVYVCVGANECFCVFVFVNFERKFGMERGESVYVFMCVARGSHFF